MLDIWWLDVKFDFTNHNETINYEHQDIITCSYQISSKKYFDSNISQQFNRISGRTWSIYISAINLKLYFRVGCMIACPSKYVAPHQMISIIKFRLKLNLPWSLLGKIVKILIEIHTPIHDWKGSFGIAEFMHFRFSIHFKPGLRIRIRSEHQDLRSP